MQEYVRGKINTTLVFMNPFRTIKERAGDYDSHGDEPILALDVRETRTISRVSLISQLPSVTITLAELIKPQLSDEEYAQIAQDIIDTEIRG